MRRIMVIVLALVAALGITASTASTATTETGVTATSVKIGGTFPLTGPASLYATIPVAMKAYFSYINARRGRTASAASTGARSSGTTRTTAYNPANASADASARRAGQRLRGRRLARHRGEPRDPAVPELEEGPADARRDRRDDVGARLEDSTRGRPAGSPPTSSRASSTGRRSRATARTPRSASSTRTTTTARTTSPGSRRASGARRRTSSTRSRSRSPRPSVASQIAKLKASGATIFVILATPGKTIQAYATANALRWSPDVIYTNSVSATDTFLTARQGQRRRRPRQQDLQRAVREGPGEPEVGQRPGDEALQAGDGEVLPEGPRHRRASTSTASPSPTRSRSCSTRPGKNPTRDSLMKAFRSWNEANPFLLPGMKQRTGVSGQFPIKCEQMMKYTDGTFQPVSATKCATTGT